jgi:hypothetical protein
MEQKLPTAYCLLFIFTAYCLFSSCGRCQTCKVKDSVGNTVYYSDEQCGGIEKYKSDLKAQWVCYNYTVNDSDGVTVYISPQVCGNIDSLAFLKDSLYNVFIADSPTVVVTPLFTRVECANHGE